MCIGFFCTFNIAMKNHSILWSLLGLLLLVLPACQKDEPVDEAKALRELLARQDVEINNYLTQNNITAQKDEWGIYREQVQANATGEVVSEGDVALLHYTFKTLAGEVVATSIGAAPVRITQSPNRAYLPYALGENLQYVKVGETYRFYVPSPYAYDTYSDEEIPAQAILIMELQVLDVYHNAQEVGEAEQADIQAWLLENNRTSEVLANGLHKIVLQEGTGELPVNGDTAKVYYKGSYLSGEVFDQNLTGDGFRFKLGNQAVVEGFEQAVKSMKVGEKALFILPSALAYRNTGVFALPHDKIKKFQEAGYISTSQRIIPPFSTLVFELELLSK